VLTHDDAQNFHFAPIANVRDVRTAHEFSRDHLQPDFHAKYIFSKDKIKSLPYAPVSHPFVERLIGTIRREYLDRVFFWTAVDLAQAEGIRGLLQRVSRPPLARWHDPRAMRRRILSCSCLA
jgi:hypothetical protein